MAELVRDPVCGMMVEDGQHATEYLKISHSFCSLQCRERFLANPNLYVGAPGHRAPKSAGLEVIKQRRLRLAQALLPGQADVLRPALQAMMGVQSVSVEGDFIVIVYDLLQATTEQIGQRLSEIGIQLGIGWPERLKRAFVHYEEECEIGNLEADPTMRSHRH
ncbi:MAG TPA: YHS domain-containing protein [Burkholderiales bacterium]|nr:YHS domain-containing protein [Burkholderiales bacterium]